MKTQCILLASALLLLCSCGPGTQVASNYQDGIYYRGEKVSPTVIAQSKNETDALVAKTRSSRIFLKQGQVDTLVIPENMSAA